MALDQALLDAISETETVIDSTIVFINGLAAQLENMGGSREEEQAAAVELRAKAQELAGRIVTNTPAAP